MPDLSLPTEAEIGRLPLLAQVAFAAHCARRVMPLFRVFATDRNLRKQVNAAITTAENVAARTDFNVPPSADKVLPDHLKSTAWSESKEVLYAITLAADHALRAALLARASSPDESEVSESASIAVDASAGAANNLMADRGAQDRSAGVIERAIRRDFDTIAAVAAAENWGASDRVLAGAFGPMWPAGPPDWWPVDDDPGDIILELGVPADTPDEEVIRLAAEAAAHADAIYRAGGGPA